MSAFVIFIFIHLQIVVMAERLIKVDTLSELFIEWDNSLRAAEEQVGKLERDKEERRKLGYE